MPNPYTILNVRLFLELHGQIIDPRIARGGLPDVLPPASFLSAAREELGLNHYRSSKHGAAVFGDFWNPRVEYIDPLPAPRERQAFFAAQAKTLWEACCSQFETLPPRPLTFTASLLVEYELGAEVPLSEEDTRFLFLDCKRRFIGALAAYRKGHPGGSEAEAVNETWAGVAHDMRMEYGLPEERLQGIVKEGTPKWNTMTEVPGDRLSFAHPSAVHWVLTPSPRPRYTARVVRRPATDDTSITQPIHRAERGTAAGEE